MFGGTDTPYSASSWASLTGTPTAYGCSSYASKSLSPYFGPMQSTGIGDNAVSAPMAIMVGGGPVAIYANMTNSTERPEARR